MNHFKLWLPTRIIFGAGEFEVLGKEARQYGKVALLVKTVGPLEELGVYGHARELLCREGMEVVELNDVGENPKLSSVYEGIRICREKNVDIIIAVGGGSAIDCAKAVAFGAVSEGDVWDYFENKLTASKALPIGAVSTIAATGAEMSVHCVITNEEKQLKLAVHYPFTLPKFSIIDPNLHKTVPRKSTASGMTDIITHVMESYFENNGQMLTDRIAEGIVHTVFACEPVLEQPSNLDYRGELAWCAVLAINGLTDAGRNSWIYGAHEIAHGLSALYNTVHGTSLAVIHPAWLTHLCEQNYHPEKFVQFGKRIFGMEQGIDSDITFGLKAIEALRQKYIQWGMPKNLREFGVEKERLEDIAISTIANPISPLNDKEEVLSVLMSCY